MTTLPGAALTTFPGAVLLVAAALSSSLAADGPALRGGGGISGAGQYREGRWGVVTTTVSNPTDGDADLMVSLWFTASPGAQFAAPLWLPPHSMRQVWVPVYVPHVPAAATPDRANVARSGVTLATEAVLIDTGESPAQTVARQDGALVAAGDPVLGAMLADGNELDSIHAAVAMRAAAGLKPRMSYLKDQTLPAIAAGWDAIDTLTISERQPDLDPARLDALRGWLVAGGRLWIMLDRVSPDFAASLLGDDWSVEVVDRVALPAFVIEGDEQPTEKSFDEPVDLVRVLATGFEVTHTVRGPQSQKTAMGGAHVWPAAMRRPIGNGWLLVTTLGPRGWMSAPATAAGFRDRPPEVARELAGDSPAELAGATGPPGASLRTISRWFIDARRRDLPGPSPALHAYAAGQIERRVIARSFVAATLGAFCLAILLSGLWLGRRDRLAFVAPIGAATAVAAAAILVGVGAGNRHTTAATAADVHLVYVAPGQRVAAAEGLVSLYSPDARDAQLSGAGGAVIFPAQPVAAGRIARMVWTDFDRWIWQGLEAPGGAISTLASRQSAPFAEPLRATLRFTEEGVVGKVQAGPLAPLEDGVVATPDGAFAVRLHDDGSYSAKPGADDRHASPGQLSDAVAMTDGQQRRQAVYAALFSQPGYAHRPTLLAWSHGWPRGWRALPDARRESAALLAVPLEIERPRSGTRVAVPAAFVRFENLYSGRYKGGVGIYNASLGRWNQMARGGQVYVRFTLPDEALPMRVESARLLMNARIPGRSVHVSILRDGRRSPAGSSRSATGPITFDLPTDPPLLADGRGAVELVLDVSDLADPAGLQTWTLEHLRLRVVGVVQPR